jgi:hypothetical protein
MMRTNHCFWGPFGFLIVLPLMSCTGLEPKPDSPEFLIPPPPKAHQSIPARPTLYEGDVVGGMMAGEASPRICFRPERWQEVMDYMIELEAYSRSQSELLLAHIQKLERQIAKMNQILKTDR